MNLGISIGTIIVQPIIENSLIKTLIAAAIFTIALLFMEWTFLTGKARIVIDHGHVHTENLKRMRLTADQLEMHSKAFSQLLDNFVESAAPAFVSSSLFQEIIQVFSFISLLLKQSSRRRLGSAGIPAEDAEPPLY
ncbi:hypothetical protein JN25_05470 [Bacillus sp. BSC154]|nr:hypothetical protein JN25_05470 [Bacillus sp. BSC154]